jgi:hypothetical protein
LPKRLDEYGMPQADVPFHVVLDGLKPLTGAQQAAEQALAARMAELEYSREAAKHGIAPVPTIVATPVATPQPSGYPDALFGNAVPAASAHPDLTQLLELHKKFAKVLRDMADVIDSQQPS